MCMWWILVSDGGSASHHACMRLPQYATRLVALGQCSNGLSVFVHVAFNGLMGGIGLLGASKS